MSESTHPAAPHHLPGFIVAPGESDILFTVVVCLLIGIVLLVGAFYFKLHALPEKMAHSANSTQLQLIGILALLALFTHNNIFWVAALILAALRVPDFTTPLNAIARSLGDLSSRFQRTEVVRLENPPLVAESPAAAAPEISETATTPSGATDETRQ
jgi:hypothetical protein